MARPGLATKAKGPIVGNKVETQTEGGKLRGVRTRDPKQLWENVRLDCVDRAKRAFGPQFYLLMMAVPPREETYLQGPSSGEEREGVRVMFEKFRLDNEARDRMNLRDKTSREVIDEVSKALKRAYEHLYRPAKEYEPYPAVRDIVAQRIEALMGPEGWLRPYYHSQVYPPREPPWERPGLDSRVRLIMELDYYDPLEMGRPLNLNELTIISLLRGNKPRQDKIEGNPHEWTPAMVFKEEKNLLRPLVLKHQNDAARPKEDARGARG